MGQAKSIFTEQELADYTDLTYFNKSEVLRYSNLKLIAIQSFKTWMGRSEVAIH